MAETANATALPPAPSILLLGEGDFSFSCDLARFLAHNLTKKKVLRDNDGPTTINLKATGIDSRQEVEEKYKDCAFLLGKLKSLSPAINVQVCHEVNAIIQLDGSRDDDGKTKKSDDRRKERESSSDAAASFVIFNHPHLGLENARRHAQFLAHLFYSVAHCWMKPEGRFFLTLAAGQWERWDGPAAAQRCGFELLSRLPFQPPAIMEQDPTSYYQHRRHQTGKSFAARVDGGSETFTFSLRQGERRSSDALVMTKPFWLDQCNLPPLQQSGSNGHAARKEKKTGFACNFCDKCFAQERSLKNHVLSKHDGQRKRKLENDGGEADTETHTCQHCSRTFGSDAGLRDHIRATHGALHAKIKPDWWRSEAAANVAPAQGRNSSTDSVELFLCSICGAAAATREDHMGSFTPASRTNQGLLTSDESFHCGFCNKAFRERRAQLQHENFCSVRRETAPD